MTILFIHLDKKKKKKKTFGDSILENNTATEGPVPVPIRNPLAALSITSIKNNNL